MPYVKGVLFCVFLLCVSNSVGKAIEDGSSYLYYPDLKAKLKLHREPTDWQTARMKCHDERAILASPWNDQFWSLLLLKLAEPEDLTIYAAVQQHFPEGIYKNINGTQILSRKFQDTKDLARCEVYHPNGTRELVDCNLPFAFVCQAPVGCEESDYIQDSRTGSCYKFHDTCETWDDAYETCQKEGAHLAIINSDLEAVVLREMCYNEPWEMLTNIDPEVSYQCVAVGFYYWKEANTYITIQGESIEQVEFNKWSSDPGPSRTLSGGIMYFNGLLGDIDKSRRVPFICEKKPVLELN